MQSPLIVILCGGLGRQLDNYSFPKPLNLIYGRPAIYYLLARLPAELAVHFVVGEHLIEYNFEAIVRNLFGRAARTYSFSYLPYFTRGPLESAWLGVRDLVLPDDQPLVFLDNDVLYQIDDPVEWQKLLTIAEPVVGYSDISVDLEMATDLGWITFNDQMEILTYHEKPAQPRSTTYASGLYGFANKAQWTEYARATLEQGPSSYYLSAVYQYLLAAKIPVKARLTPMIQHIGTLQGIETSLDQPKSTAAGVPPGIRVCFDLDNTLVTYPMVAGDYSTVQPIVRNIELLRKLHAQGHTIIIYTARRMTTHGGNVGRVIADIGAVTIETLKKFEIPYHELYFGKPMAQIYIDDRAANPYRTGGLAAMGLLQEEPARRPLNMLSGNKYHQIYLHPEAMCVEKRGPAASLEGELRYYEQIPESLARYFPQRQGYRLQDMQITLFLEYIVGVPLYLLYRHGMLTTGLMAKVLDFLDQLHRYEAKIDGRPAAAAVKTNYIDKLIERFQHVEDYPFPEAAQVQVACLARLQLYQVKEIVHFIHGDCWFSNILVDEQNALKFLDMKGYVSGPNGRRIYTTGGDPMYDYAKLYQSILGFDAALYGHSINSEAMIAMHDWFLDEMYHRGIDINDLETVTFGLVIGTFHAIETSEAKTRVWKWIKAMFTEA
jgi:capsule biosynthesis phosphatase